MEDDHILVLSQFEVCLFYIYLYNKRLLSLCSMNLNVKNKIQNSTNQQLMTHLPFNPS